MPAASIIIPAYNLAPYIGETLDSAFAQTCRDFEVIVVNDGSKDTDRLETELARFAGRITYLKQENKGPGAARNKGLSAAIGTWVVFLDGDDLLEPRFLDRMLETAAESPGYAVHYADATLFGEPFTGPASVMQRSPSQGEVTFESLISLRCTVMAGSALVSREAVEAVGGFNESLRGTEDLYLWLSIVKSGGRIRYIREPLTRYRLRAGSLSHQRVALAEQILAALDQARRELRPTKQEMEAIEKRSALVRAEIELHRGRRAFFDGDAQTAAAHLRKANEFFRSRKISLIVAALRVAPGLLLSLYHARDRFLFRARTAH